MGEKLSRRQRQALDYIVSTIREQGYPPTVREIAEKLSLASTNAARKHLLTLQRKGYLKVHPFRSRGIELTESGARLAVIGASRIPVIGRIAAGSPVLATENWEGSLVLDQELGKGEGLFALQVRGDSMKEAGILDGDYAIVKSQPTADPGEIVAVLIQDIEPEATLKGYFPRKDQVVFEPANRKFKPIAIPKKSDIEWRILGKVVGIVRKGVVRMTTRR